MNSLESELGGVFHLRSICEMFGEQFGIRIRWCFPPVQHLWQVWWSAWRKISMVFLCGICGSCGGRLLVVCTPCHHDRHEKILNFDLCPPCVDICDSE